MKSNFAQFLQLREILTDPLDKKGSLPLLPNQRPLIVPLSIAVNSISPEAAPAPPDVDSSLVATASSLEISAFSSAADIASIAWYPWAGADEEEDSGNR